jgi:hypothetical protein
MKSVLTVQIILYDITRCYASTIKQSSKHLHFYLWIHSDGTLTNSIFCLVMRQVYFFHVLNCISVVSLRYFRKTSSWLLPSVSVMTCHRNITLLFQSVFICTFPTIPHAFYCLINSRAISEKMLKILNFLIHVFHR